MSCNNCIRKYEKKYVDPPYDWDKCILYSYKEYCKEEDFDCYKIYKCYKCYNDKRFKDELKDTLYVEPFGTSYKTAVEIIIFELQFLMKAAQGIKPADLKWGAEKIYGFFSQNSESKTQETLEKIQSELENIKKSIQKLEERLIEDNLKRQINAFNDDTDLVSIINKRYMGAIRKIECSFSGGSGKIDQVVGKSQKELLLQLYYESIDGNSFCDAVMLYGSKLLKKDIVTGKDIFQAFDELALVNYKWEHLGYEKREAFQSSGLAMYTSLANLSRLSIMAHLQDEKVQSKIIMLETQLSNLDEQVKQIYELSISRQVKRRPDNQRFYQVSGHTKLLMAQAYRQIVPTVTKKDDVAVWYIQPFTKAGGNSVPNRNWFSQVYGDYGGNKSLYEIFFSLDEGGFITASGIDSNARFVADSLEYEQPVNRRFVYAYFFSNDGKCSREKVATWRHANFAEELWNLKDTNLIGLAVMV